MPDDQSKQIEFINVWTVAQPVVAAMVYTSIRDHQHAEDILQEIARAAFASFDRYDNQQPFRPWVMGIARNHVNTFLRRHYRGSMVLDPDTIAQVADAFDRLGDDSEDRRDALRRCLARLHRRAKQVLEMRYFNETPVKAIAKAIDATPHAVSMVLYKSRLALRKCINQQLGLDEGDKP